MITVSYEIIVEEGADGDWPCKTCGSYNLENEI